MTRMSLPTPLRSASAVVRELQADDAGIVAAEAADGEPLVRGRIAVPRTPDEAVAQLSEFALLREQGRGNLFGVFGPRDGRLTGVASFMLEGEAIAEAACWNQDKSRRREVTAAGIGLLTEYAHMSMKIVQLWVEVDPIDPFAAYLATKCGFTQMPSDHQNPRTVRYLSVG